MNWQSLEDIPSENPNKQFSFKKQKDDTPMINELEEKKAVQLNKFKDPATDPERQSYITLISQFGDLLTNNKFDEMISTILTKDCEFFIFNTTRRSPVQYCLNPEGIPNLYKGVKVHNRVVNETYVDLQKNTAVQFSHYIVKYEDEESPVEEIVAEIFTIKDNKISRYRGSFSRSTPAHGDKDPFEISRRDRIMMKMKEINYAIAGQPDLEKIASFLSEDAQYKIWSWESSKCFSFGKHDFAEGFKKLQEYYEIKSCVPYDISFDRDHIIGTYVYHLEGKLGKFADQKFVWLSTCAFTFDENLNLTKVIQQGELHSEGDVPIPFEVYSRERIAQLMIEINEHQKPSLDLFYQDVVHFAVPMYRYAAKGLHNVGLFEGLNHMAKILEAGKQGPQGYVAMDWRKIVEFFIDSNGSGYDVAVLVTCSQGMFNFSEFEYNGLKINNFIVMRHCLDKGKILKAFMAVCAIPEPIPSPFEDPNFEGVNIIPRSKYSGSKTASS